MTMDAFAGWIDQRKWTITNNACARGQPLYILWAADRIVAGIEWIERVIFCHHNARVLADTENRLCRLLCYVTGDKLSKPSYSWETMQTYVDEYLSERDDLQCDDLREQVLNEVVEDAMGLYTVLRPKALYDEEVLGPVLWWTVDANGKALGKPYPGRPTDIEFPSSARYYTSIVTPDVLEVELDIKTQGPWRSAKWQNEHKYPPEPILPTPTERLPEPPHDPAPAVTRGLAEGFAGDADAPR